LVIRRFKKDVREQLKESFPEREIDIISTPASAVEEIAYEQLGRANFQTLDGQGAGQLFRTVLEKALFSSPHACLSTIENRLKRLKARTQNNEILADISTLEGLRLCMQAIKPAEFSKYQKLVDLLSHNGTSSLGWNPKQANDRLVIFTESLATLEFLREHLPTDIQNS